MKKSKILIADDEQVIRELLLKFLSNEGYEVYQAIDGFDALDKIKNNDYGMAILDLKMPGINGMEIITKVKELNKDLAIIVITGYATLETAKAAIKLGCFEYITKPFNMDDVIATIKRAFNMRQLAEDKKRLEEQLEVSERLASLAEMGAGVAHEVNTVLATIKLFLELLRTKFSSQKKEGRNLELILGEVEHAEKIIARFLNFTKPSVAEFTRTDINRIIKKGLQLFETRLSQNKIEVFLQLSTPNVFVECDPIKMEEVFSNIFLNSIDAMDSGGKLFVRTEVEDEKILIEIRDTGAGIPAQNLEKIYDPFFTTKASGTGLGLSIVHRIIEEHQGIIKITSEENQGTCVKIELPVSVKPQRLTLKETPEIKIR
jgi:hypothetical protein